MQQRGPTCHARRSPKEVYIRFSDKYAITFSHRFLSCRFSGGSRCFEERPCASGSTSIVFPFRAQTIRHRHLFAGLIGCNRSRALLFICHSLIYIYSCLSLYLVPLVSSALTGCVPMFPCSYVHGSLSFPFPLYHLLFGPRPPWSRLVSPRTRVVTRQRK